MLYLPKAIITFLGVIMHKTALLILIMWISGCAITSEQLRKTTPSLGFTSTHHSEFISKCIYNGWGNKHNLKSDYQPTMFGHTVSLYINDNLAHIIDIANTLTGSNTTVFSNKEILGKTPSLSAMQACQPSNLNTLSSM